MPRSVEFPPRVDMQSVYSAQQRLDCQNGIEPGMERIQADLAGKTPAEQYAFLRSHYRDDLERIGDVARRHMPMNRETDEQSVERILRDIRTERFEVCLAPKR